MRSEIIISMEIPDKTIYNFFKVADLVLSDKEKHPEAVLLLQRIVSQEKYKLMRTIYEFYKDGSSINAAKNKIEAFFYPRIQEINQFIKENEELVPETKGDDFDSKLAERLNKW